jgi:hypothetical protein
VNLLPVPPLDGAAAWRLVPLALRRLRRRSRPSPATARRPLAPLSTETEAHLREVLTRARDIGKKN